MTALITEDEYRSVRQSLAKIRGLPGLRKVDDMLATSVQTATELAITENRLKVVTAPTGTGKTTATIAYAVAAAIKSEDFSCSFILNNNSNCREVFDELVKLFEATGYNLKPFDLGFRTMKVNFDAVTGKPIGPYDLDKYRIIILTHKKFIDDEDKKSRRAGARYYNDKRRSVCFIDEHIETVKLFTVKPNDIKWARDLALQFKVNDVADAYDEIGAKMEPVLKSATRDYVSAELVTRQNLDIITEPGNCTLQGNMVTEYHERYANIRQFVEAAETDYVFYSRKSQAFVGYSLKFKPTQSFVLLDATADITGMTALIPGMDHVEVPKINYQNLSITQFDIPKAWAYANKALKPASQAREYIKWMKQVIKENTGEGDKILVVTNLILINNHQMLPRATHGIEFYGDKPIPSVKFQASESKRAKLGYEDEKGFGPVILQDCNNVEANIIWWGGRDFIGTNKYAACTKVFLFNEHHIGKEAHMAKSWGYQQKPATDGDLSSNHAAGTTDDVRLIQEGHLLRNGKQTVSRGSVRECDDNLVCGRMELFTSMEYTRLLGNLDRLFPGLKPNQIKRLGPVKVGRNKPPEAPKPSRAQRVLEVMASLPDDVDRISYKQIAENAGLVRSHLTPTLKLPEVDRCLRASGWGPKRAIDIGESGQDKYAYRTGYDST